MPAAPAPTAAQPAQETQGATVIVRSRNGLNLRAQANTSSEVLCVVPDSTVLTVLDGEDNGFLHVRWGNFDGYVSEAFVVPGGAE